MAPNSTPFNTPMDPLVASRNVAKAILNAPTENGKLVATILSAYDLPYDEAVPTGVTMSYTMQNGQGGVNEISTGPPAARHRDHANSFKFGGASTDQLASMTKSPNTLELSAPLSTLFESVVTFTLTYADPTKNLTSRCTVHRTLRVNDTQWLILNLESAREYAARMVNNGGSHEPKTAAGGSGEGPTLRLKLRLTGPYRPEVSAIINVSNTWFHAMDAITDTTVGPTVGASQWLGDQTAVKLLLVPFVPLASLGTAILPIIGGILLICLPFFLPVVLIILAASAAVAAIGSAAYFSTRDGRTKIQHLIEPSYQMFLLTKTGQRIVYDVGPRPSPQNLAEAVLPTDMIGKLVVSLIVDLIGSASYLIPVAGEGFDLAWAPISMTLVGALYDGVMPSLKYVALAEELLPFTDFVPTATVGWVTEFAPILIDQGKRTMGMSRASRETKVVRMRQ